MRRYPLVLLCCVVLAFSCSSSKPKPDTAESKATYGSLQLGLPGSVKMNLSPQATGIYPIGTRSGKRSRRRDVFPVWDIYMRHRCPRDGDLEG